MSKKSNANYVKLTSGKLSYIKQWNLTITDTGALDNNVDFSSETWEEGNSPDHLVITNDGNSNDLYVVFDADGDTITTTDRTTYNLKIPKGQIRTLDGSCSSIGFRTASGLSTTVELIAW